MESGLLLSFWLEEKKASGWAGRTRAGTCLGLEAKNVVSDGEKETGGLQEG